MMPNMNPTRDAVLPTQVTEDHDDHLQTPPSSPTSVCESVRENSNLTPKLSTSVPPSLFKDKSKRRSSRTAGVRRRLSTSSSSSNTQHSTTPSQKSVAFHSRVRFKHVKHIDDYSDREYFATWYVEEDLQDIFNHCVDTVRMMVNGLVLDEEKGYSPRGLEYKTPTGAKTRKHNKSRGIRAVLDEQERQRVEGVNDPERLAKLYYESAADSRRAYRLLAMKDQEEARPILQSRSSIVIMRERFQQEQRHKKDKDATALDQEKLHNSATSVMDEFQQFYHGPGGSGDDTTAASGREYRVSFGTLHETTDDFA
jgi:hypothetical protein